VVPVPLERFFQVAAQTLPSQPFSKVTQPASKPLEPTRFQVVQESVA